jgi:cobalt-zinc-cadmium efflux system protein
MAIVAAAGIVINATTALLFFRDKESDLNVKGAYLHMAADAVVSLGVVITGVLINYTQLLWLDPAISIVIMLVILYSTWGLLTDSIRLSLDAVPRNVDVEQVKTEVMQVKGVIGIHHIHVWALSTRINALTAHLVIDETLTSHDEQLLKDSVKHQLLHLNIQHATLETERGIMDCKEEVC